MKSGKYNISKEKIRVYNIEDSIIFKKNKDRYGELSNMHMGFPLKINNINILNTEALYQACRFPHIIDLQRKIINEKSPMKVKMISNANKKKSREDFDEIKLKVMKWCLNLKLAQNFITFGYILDSTKNLNIVENSKNDNFWGAVPDMESRNYTGQNALGRLLMQLREQYRSKNKYSLLIVEQQEIADFTILEQQISEIDCRNKFTSDLLKYFDNQQIELFN